MINKIYSALIILPILGVVTDEVLKFICLHLRERFRGSDLACRFGGEEFLIVLLDVDIAIAYARLQSIREEIKNAKVYFQSKLLPSITISIGVAEAPKNGYVQDDIIRAADDALYMAKRTGRDRVEIFRSPEKHRSHKNI
ncbi:MAG: GGDEF domain-containing protein [Gammaproteobacteria bacterium]